jgi:acetyl esterase/lipase
MIHRTVISQSIAAALISVTLPMNPLAAPKVAPNYGPQPVPLYVDGAPGAKGDGEAHNPTLRVYLPDNDIANGAGVVICPGGGYRGLAIDHEGQQLARYFNKFGVAAFVLRYRLSPDYKHPTPLNDAQRAMQFVRSNAAEYGVDKNRVGIMGFSAGGHLASSLATHWHRGKADAADAIARESCRPDFAILGYPVVTFTEEKYMHRGSKKNLLGEDPDSKLVELMSNEKQVNAETPPSFLHHTGEDTSVPPENNVLFYLALRKAKVPAELHIFQKGSHGLGLGAGDPVLSSWGGRLEDWLRTNGFFTDQERQALTGEITIDGDPITRGWITLNHTTDPHAPQVVGYLRKSKIAIKQEDGPIPGDYNVEIRVMSQRSELRPTIEDVRIIDADAAGTPLKATITSDTKSLAFHVKTSTQFPMKKVWGAIELGLGYLKLNVKKASADNQLDIPRLNNRIGSVYLDGDKDRHALKFVPEIDHWLVTLPKNAKYPLAVIIEIKDGAPYLPTEPRIVRPEPDGAINFHAYDAVTHGEKLRFEPQPHKNTVGYWVNTEDWCEWHFTAKPGDYKVYIWQGCGTGQGGSEVGVASGNTTVKFIVEDTGHFQNFKQREIGVLKLNDTGDYKLRLKPIKKAKNAVMDVRRIKLVPVR